jgi:hypothetical protein
VRFGLGPVPLCSTIQSEHLLWSPSHMNKVCPESPSEYRHQFVSPEIASVGPISDSWLVIWLPARDTSMHPFWLVRFFEIWESWRVMRFRQRSIVIPSFPNPVRVVKSYALSTTKYRYSILPDRDSGECDVFVEFWGSCDVLYQEGQLQGRTRLPPTSTTSTAVNNRQHHS